MKSDPHSDRVLIHHIRTCINRIGEYTENDRLVFFASNLVQDAVIRNLQTIAESTLKESSPDSRC